MKNEQFNGFKSPGGVFIHLVKKCEDFSKESVAKLFHEEKKYMKNKAKVQSAFSSSVRIQ